MRRTAAPGYVPEAGPPSDRVARPFLRRTGPDPPGQRSTPGIAMPRRPWRPGALRRKSLVGGVALAL
jgi:hypothetical protein